MPLPATNFQPYDRVTGTELSPQQQSTSRPYYYIIKAYIDGYGVGAGFSVAWTRKNIRCSTAELLESIEHLADDIRQSHRSAVVDGTSSISSWAETEGKKLLALDPKSVDLATKRYQHAVNLLHEFVARLTPRDDETGVSLNTPEISTLHPLISEKDVANIDERIEGLNTTSCEVSPNSEQPDEIIEVKSTAQTLSVLSSAEHSDVTHFPDSWIEVPSADVAVQHLQSLEKVEFPSRMKLKPTSSWAIEYLRGGWYFKSPSSVDEKFYSPMSPLSRETSPGGSFRMLLRTDSDNSNISDDGARQFPRTAFAGARTVRHGYPVPRPIPTMATRFKPKVSFDLSLENSGDSPVSAMDFFKTPRSIMSGGTVFATPEASHNPQELSTDTTNTSVWNKYLREKGLIPDPFEEMNWSGRGQHAEFESAEEDIIPLEYEKTLGHSATALVDSVKCRRIRLARKTVQVSRHLKKEEAFEEVEHLQRLKHPHVIRVIGTYTLPRKLSILLYPVADYTLDVFLESIKDGLAREERDVRLYSTSTFLRCLAKAVAYIHDKLMKHMDLKPKNLLVRDMQSSTICNQGRFKIYIADFGVARSYRSTDDINTETPIAYTRMYAAPEVVAQELRDQKADIFSLGAVYAEMLSVLSFPIDPHIANLELLHSIRESDPMDQSYAMHAPNVQEFVRDLCLTSYGFESDTPHSHITELVALMLSQDPTKRPTAATIVENMPFLAFCCDVNGGPEPFESANRPLIRQLYDRAMELVEADERYWRCSVEGCVKVYSSRERLGYHSLNGHGEANITAKHDVAMPNVQNPAFDGHLRHDWSTF